MTGTYRIEIHGKLTVKYIMYYCNSPPMHGLSYKYLTQSDAKILTHVFVENIGLETAAVHIEWLHALEHLKSNCKHYYSS